MSKPTIADIKKVQITTTTFLNDLISEKITNTEKLADYIQSLWKSNYIVTEDFFDFVPGKTLMGLSKEQQTLIINPPPNITSAKPQTLYQIDLDHIAFTSWTIDEWYKKNKDKDGNEHMAVCVKDKIAVSLALGDMLYQKGRTLENETKARPNIYLKLDPQHNELRLIAGSESETLKAVRITMARALANGNHHVTSKQLLEMCAYWDNTTEALGSYYEHGSSLYVGAPIVSATNPIREQVKGKAATTYWSSHEPVEGDFPNLQEFFSRVSDPKALAAFFYGVYSGLYVGRQGIWLHGPGNSGKSLFINTFATMLFGLDRGYATITDAILRSKSDFTNANYIGKLLLVYPDCSFPTCTASENFKILTNGNDAVTYNVKFEASVTAMMIAKMVVASNFSPAVQNQPHYLSRTIYLTISEVTKLKQNMDVLYKKELNACLFWMKQCYDELCPDNLVIKTTDKTIALTKSLVGTNQSTYSYIFDQSFEATSMAYDELSQHQVMQELELYEKLKSKNETDKFINWMHHTMGIPYERGVTHRKVFQGIKFKKNNNTDNTDKGEINFEN